MFVMCWKRSFLLIFILFVAACSEYSGVNGGLDPDATLFLDGDYLFELSIEKGEVFALDVLIPLQKGHDLVGASFDPDVCRLEHYLQYDEDGAPRARYIFTTLEKGASDVLIKMAPIQGGDVEIYKQVSLRIGDDNGLF